MLKHLIDIPSVKDHLNPDIWDGWRLRELVRARLLLIAEEFMEYLNLDVATKDVLFTGSLANFNWSTHSDVDLHVLIDYSEIDENVGLVESLLMAKKSQWNAEHDIKIKGFEVECYPQEAHEPHHSTGVYSLVEDRWIHRPSQSAPSIDLRAVNNKVSGLKSRIDHVVEDGDRREIEMLRQKIGHMRKCGLEEGGEYSVENLAFKVLRRNGYLAKLKAAETDAYDAELSLESEG